MYDKNIRLILETDNQALDINSSSKPKPIRLLARKGYHRAVTYLIEGLKASRDDAVEGYAEGGFIDKVNENIEAGASQNHALRGYARVGNPEVEQLLKAGANPVFALQGYQLGNQKYDISHLLEYASTDDLRRDLLDLFFKYPEPQSSNNSLLDSPSAFFSKRESASPLSSLSSTRTVSSITTTLTADNFLPITSMAYSPSVTTPASSYFRSSAYREARMKAAQKAVLVSQMQSIYQEIAKNQSKQQEIELKTFNGEAVANIKELELRKMREDFKETEEASQLIKENAYMISSFLESYYLPSDEEESEPEENRESEPLSFSRWDFFNPPSEDEETEQEEDQDEVKQPSNGS